MIRYLPAVVWIVLLSYVLTRHIRVYKLYDRQLKVVRAIEEEGAIETGSTLVAVNQRVRYIIRILLAFFGILIGIGGVYGVYRPGFGRSVAFGIAVISYFYLSEAATGYLTIRDQRVIDRILEIDHANAMAAQEAAAQEDEDVDDES